MASCERTWCVVGISTACLLSHIRPSLQNLDSDASLPLHPSTLSESPIITLKMFSRTALRVIPSSRQLLARSSRALGRSLHQASTSAAPSSGRAIGWVAGATVAVGVSAWTIATQDRIRMEEKPVADSKSWQWFGHSLWSLTSLGQLLSKPRKPLHFNRKLPLWLKS